MGVTSNQERVRSIGTPGEELPVVMTDEVFHIGTMNQTEKAVRFIMAGSLEGRCLSVSHCPEAWRTIAKLGGAPLWQLRNSAGVFLDVLKAARARELRNLIEAWGIETGHVEWQTRWQAWDADEEGGWRYRLCATEGEAQAEVDCNLIEEGSGGDSPVKKVEVLIGTDRLCRRVGHKRMDDMDAFDFLALAWCEDTQPQIDGIWWREDYAPERLSAPRGGIFPGRMNRWKSAGVELSAVPDDDEIEDRLIAGFISAAAVAKKPRGAPRRN